MGLQISSDSTLCISLGTSVHDQGTKHAALAPLTSLRPCVHSPPPPATQIPFDSTVRISLDTNLCMIKENPEDGPTCAATGRWYRDPNLAIHRSVLVYLRAGEKGGCMGIAGGTVTPTCPSTGQSWGCWHLRPRIMAQGRGVCVDRFPHIPLDGEVSVTRSPPACA